MSYEIVKNGRIVENAPRGCKVCENVLVTAQVRDNVVDDSGEPVGVPKQDLCKTFVCAITSPTTFLLDHTRKACYWEYGIISSGASFVCTTTQGGRGEVNTSFDVRFVTVTGVGTFDMWGRTLYWKW